jgi:probable rRNA maturation factor
VSGSLFLKNRQRRHKIDVRHLRRIIRSLLVEDFHCDEFELGVFLVGEAQMIRMNEGYLGHAGSTDVITFDYCEAHAPAFLAGDIFVCVDEAAVQARKFRTSWQSEVVRYVVHGILHLRGYDDTGADARRKMKAAEDKLVRGLSTRFNFLRLGGHLRCRAA